MNRIDLGHTVGAAGGIVQTQLHLKTMVPETMPTHKLPQNTIVPDFEDSNIY